MKALTLGLTMAFAGVAFARTYTWKGTADRVNDWNWCEDGNFVEESAPPGMCDDIVVVPAGVRVRLLAEDDSSCRLVNALSLVNVQGSGADVGSVEINVGNNEKFSLLAPIHNWDEERQECNVVCGRIVKTGAGALVLAASGNNDYQTSIEVVEGVLKMNPEARGSSNYMFCDLIVSNGASLFTAPNGAYTRFVALRGTGTITNDTPNGSMLIPTGGTPTIPNVIEAFISPNIIFGPAGYVRMACASNMNNWCYAQGGGGLYPSGKGVVETPSFGSRLMPSYLGCLDYMQTLDGGGFYRYIGTDDETTTVNLSVSRPRTGASGIDAGPHGGVTFTGYWEVSSKDGIAGNANFYLCGSNAVPCKISCSAVAPNSDLATFSFTKSGTGTWRFTDTGNRYNRGSLWVDEGTVQFESIAEQGTTCSLGLSTLLFPRGYCGAIDGAETVDYAFSLGSEGKIGTLEYVGTNTVRQSTRSVALAGDGRLVNAARDNGAAARRYFSWFAGVKSIAAGLNRLILDGASDNGADEVANVTDGAVGRVGIVKQGTGTWRLTGVNTFSGPIEVKQGKLVLVTPHYTWFRVTFKGIKALDYPAYAGNKDTSLHELAFFDRDGFRQNIGLVRVEDSYYYDYWGNPATKFRDVLLPGEYTYAETLFFDTASSGWYYGRGNNEAERLFDHSKDNPAWVFQRYLPKTQGKTGLEDFPLPIVFRLPEGAKPVTSYDIVTHRENSENMGSYVLNPKCWTVEASVDGKNWNLLHTMEDSGASGQTLTIRGAGKWMGRDAEFSTDDGVKVPYTSGQPIAAAPSGEVGKSFADVEYVEVADGATLVAEGDITLKGIKVNAKGAGSLVGFQFADSGDFIVEGVPDESVVTLPGRYEQKLAKWTLKSSDYRVARRELVIDADGVARLYKRGFAIIVR